MTPYQLSLDQLQRMVSVLMLPPRRRSVRGRKPQYSDELIIALVVYQRLWKFAFTDKMLAWLRVHGYDVPAPSTFCERKQQLLPQIILAVKVLSCLGEQPPRLRIDSKKLPTAALARSTSTRLPGKRGRDHANRVPFYGMRLH